MYVFFFFLHFCHDSLRSIIAFVATTDITWTIGNTLEYTVRRKSARHGSAEDTSVTHCNSVQSLSFGSTQLAP